MSMQYDSEPGMIGIPAGTIDEESLEGPPQSSPGGKGKGERLRPECHIFLREKASWFVVPEDGLGRYEGFTPEMEERVSTGS